MANLLTFPNDPSNGAWGSGTGTGSRDIAYATDPDGGTNAFRLTDLSGVDIFTAAQTVTIAAGTETYFVAVWIKKTSGATNFPCLDFRFGTPSSPAKWCAMTLNTDTGVATLRSGTTAAIAYTVQNYSTDYWLFYFSLANNGQTQATIFLAPAFNTDAGAGYDLGAGGSAIFWSPILDLGSAPDLTQDDVTIAIQDRKLTGIRSLARVTDASPKSVAAAVYRGIQMLSVNTVSGGITLGASLATAYALGDLVCIGSNLYALGDDGRLHKYSTTPAETTSVAVELERPLPWLLAVGNFLLFSHSRSGALEVRNTSLAKVTVVSSGLSYAVAAAADSAGNVFIFDGRGHVSQFTLNLSTGALSFVERIAVPNAVGVVSAWIDEDEDKLLIGLPSRILSYDLVSGEVEAVTHHFGRKFTTLCRGNADYLGLYGDSDNPVLSPNVRAPFNVGMAIGEDSTLVGCGAMSLIALYVKTGG